MNRQSITGWIETFSGLQWQCAEPDPQDVRLEDVAHGLALMCRFGGQVKVPYSVGQHSLYVMELLKTWYPHNTTLHLNGLMHDGSEAYLSDLVKPLKHQIPQYLYIEAKTQEAVLQGLKIPKLSSEEGKILKAADNALLMAERRDLFSNSKFDWRLTEAPVPFKIKPNPDWREIETEIKIWYKILSRE